MSLLLAYSDPALDGPTNMARDEHLLHAEAAAGVAATLRFYGWTPPTVSLGYFQKYESLAALPPDIRALAVVRRTTGGGAILHDRELTYCLILREQHPFAVRGPVELYRAIHECFRAALAERGVESALAADELPLPTPRTGPFFCFEKPGRTDLLLGGAKVLGSAQRRIGGAVMQHGSLLTGARFAAHPGRAVEGIDDAALRIDLSERIALALGSNPVAANWSAEQLRDVEARRAKYASEEWTRRY